MVRLSVNSEMNIQMKTVDNMGDKFTKIWRVLLRHYDQEYLLQTVNCTRQCQKSNEPMLKYFWKAKTNGSCTIKSGLHLLHVAPAVQSVQRKLKADAAKQPVFSPEVLKWTPATETFVHKFKFNCNRLICNNYMCTSPQDLNLPWKFYHPWSRHMRACLCSTERILQ